MFLYLVLGLFLGYWAVASLLCYRHLKAQIQGRLKSVFRLDPTLPAQYKPFQRTDFAAWNVNRIYLNCFLTFPFKFALVFHYITTALLFVYTIVFIQTITGAQNNMVLRRMFRWYMRVYAGRNLWPICSYDEITQNGKDKKIDPIIVCNHTSWWDIFYLMATRWPISFLAKKGVDNWPIVGTIAKFGNCIFIDRQDIDARQKIVGQIKEKCEMMRSTQSDMHSPLVIFPEGTTTNGKFILKFKNGAFECLQPIQITRFNYISPEWNVSMDHMGELTNMLLFLCHSPRVSVRNVNHVMPNSPDPQKFASDCCKIMAGLGQVTPISQSGFRDKQKYQKLLNEEYKRQKSE